MNIRPIGYQSFKGTLVLKSCIKNEKNMGSVSIDTKDIEEVSVKNNNVMITAWEDYACEKNKYIVNYPSSERVLDAYTAASQSNDIKVVI